MAPSWGLGSARSMHDDSTDGVIGYTGAVEKDPNDGGNCNGARSAAAAAALSGSALRLRRASSACWDEPLPDTSTALPHPQQHMELALRQRQPDLAPAQQPPLLLTTRVFAAGICCPMEVPLVRRVLSSLRGVHSVEVAVMAQTVLVRHDAAAAPPGTLVAALNGVQLEASLAPMRAQAQVRGRWLPPWHVLAGAVLLAASLLHCLAGATAWLPLPLAALEGLSLGAVALCLPRIALRAALALRCGVVDVHLLVSIAAVGAIALADWAEAAAVTVLFALAEHWERCSTEKARAAVAAVLTLHPETATLAATGERVAAEAVAPGTHVLVAPGEAVPLDGRVVAGASTLDESLLTGESSPVRRGPGSNVHAGTLNVGAGELRVEATAAAGDSAVARMASLVEAAASQQSPAEAMVAQFARVYTPAILAACILLAFLPWLWVADAAQRSRWVYLSLQVLVTACPCALVLSTPAAVVCALACAAQRGVLIKSGAALEALRRVSVATFDKTGTLTKGHFQVVSCQVAPGWTPLRLLRLLGSLERGSSHPLAAALLGYAAAQGVACDAPVEGVEVAHGAGLSALVDGRRVVAGTPGMLASVASVAGPEIEAAQAAIDEDGATACFVAVDCQLAGWLSARDVVRPEAAEAIAMLRRLGVQPAMLTGDGAAAAGGVGATAGIDVADVHARLLPAEKLEKVAAYQHGYCTSSPSGSQGASPGRRLLQRLGPWRRPEHQQRSRRVWVAHVGDGVNDAPALAAADAGIAMGVAGSAAALEAGSVALFVSDIRAVPAVVGLARAAGAIVFQNVAFAVLTKVAVLVPAALGRFSLWGAVFVDVGSSLIVLANALRLLNWRWPLVAPSTSKAAHRHHHTGGCCSGGGCGTAHSHKGGQHAGSACCSDGGCCTAAPRLSSVPGGDKIDCSSKACGPGDVCPAVAAAVAAVGSSSGGQCSQRA